MSKQYTVGDLKKELESIPDDAKIMFCIENGYDEVVFDAKEENFTWDTVDIFFIEV